MPRMQFQLRWLMAAVAIVAILLSLPTAAVAVIGFFGAILAIMILIPAGLAPPGRRIRAASWSLALHPLLLLGWLSVWRLTAIPQPLYPGDDSLLYHVVLEIPYIMAILSLFYLPIFAVLGWTSAALGFLQRFDFKPLLFLPMTWLTTLVILVWDPFKLFVWVRD